MRKRRTDSATLMAMTMRLWLLLVLVMALTRIRELLLMRTGIWMADHASNDTTAPSSRTRPGKRPKTHINIRWRFVLILRKGPIQIVFWCVL